MATATVRKRPSAEQLLAPGDALLKCSGQDLVKKASKGSRAKIMTVFPAQLSVPEGFEGAIGTLKNINSDCPQFIMSSSKVIYEYMYIFKQLVNFNNVTLVGCFVVPRQVHPHYDEICCHRMLAQETQQHYRRDIWVSFSF